MALRSAFAPMIGEHGTVWPYTRGGYPPDTMYLLWRVMVDEQGADKLFYAQQGDGAVRGDLVEFTRYFSDESRQLFICQAPDAGPVMGFVWLDDIAPAHRAAINVFFRRAHWGHAAREMASLVIRYGFEVLHLHAVWAFTPWPLAVRMGDALGFERIAVLPDFIRVDGESHAVTIMRKTRDG